MSKPTTQDQLLDEFLDQVEAKLPQWIKDTKSKRADVLAELREHVLDKAEELAGSSNVDNVIMQKAIATMGTPESIARAYKRRSTPKIFISTELWPYYLRFFVILAVVVITANLATGIIGYLAGESIAILEAIQRIEFGLCAVFTALTLVFMWLSAEGYFPEDFDEKGKTKASEKVPERRQMVSKPAKLVAASIELFIAIIAITLPFPTLVSLMNPTFTMLIRGMGFCWLASGMFTLGEGLAGTKHPRMLQVCTIAASAVSVLAIMFLVPMILDPSIVPVIYWLNLESPMTVQPMPPEVYTAVVSGFTSIIVIVTVISAVDIVKALLLTRRIKNTQG
nr:hypothetical protein [Candidatus Sigynarchaeota archaeon]